MAKKWNKHLLPLWSSCLFILTAQGCGYWDQYQRSKQIRTFADLQTIAETIEQRRSSTGEITVQAVEGAIEAVNDGRDAWGRPFAYKIEVHEGKTSYVILSLGQDGVLDLKDIGRYFQVRPDSVAGELSRDIFFRDGRPIYNAGK